MVIVLESGGSGKSNGYSAREWRFSDSKLTVTVLESNGDGVGLTAKALGSDGHGVKG
jgi:hypothetical protein